MIKEALIILGMSLFLASGWHLAEGNFKLSLSLTLLAIFFKEILTQVAS